MSHRTRMLTTILVAWSAGIGVPRTEGDRAQSAAPATRLVHSTTGRILDVSADGRQIAICRMNGRGDYCDLVLRDIPTGVERMLVAGTPETGYLNDFVIAPDGRQVAYRRTINAQGANEAGRLSSLWVVSAQVGSPRRLISDQFLTPLDWSLDGRDVLVIGDAALKWISVADGSARTVRTFEAGRDVDVSIHALAGDARRVAYSARSGPRSDDWPIHVAELSGQETPALTARGEFVRPMWTPDGAFLVARGPTAAALSVVPVGAVPGATQPLIANDGGEPVRVLSTGQFFFVRRHQQRQNVALVDRRSGRVVQHFEGASGVWSPDGRAIAYTRARSSAREIVIRNLATGDERASAHARLPADSKLQWTPDGRSVIAFIDNAGDSNTGGGEFYRLDIEEGRFVRLFSRNTAEHVRSRVTALSADGRWLYALARASTTEPWTMVVAIDLTTGRDRLIARVPDNALPARDPRHECGLALSADGRTLAILAFSHPTVWNIRDMNARVFTVGTDGTGFRQVGGPVSTFYAPLNVLQWSPTGREILFAASSEPDSWRLFRLSLETSEVTADGLSSFSLQGSASMPEFRTVALPSRLELSRDALVIALDLSTRSVQELRVIDNLLELLRRPR